MPNKLVYLFVYGTLRPNQFRGGFLDGHTHVGRGKASGKLYNLGAFPGAKYGPEGVIIGDVFEIPPSLLTRLDFIEAEGYLYKRIQVPVTLDDDSTVTAWTYEYLQHLDENDNLIESGDYLEDSRI